MPDLRTTLRALRELGPSQMGLYALYQLGLRTGHYRRVTATPKSSPAGGPELVLRQDLFNLPSHLEIRELIGEKAGQLFEEADEIVSGQVRLFGKFPVKLRLEPQGPLEHWTACERTAKTGLAGGASLNSPYPSDIKFTWEPGRFGWAFTLGRAYHLSGNERYAQAFWELSERFLSANPPYLGPHWISAQEVALRLIAMVWAAPIFAPSEHSTRERMARLGEAVAVHAERIPPTLVYARSQHNNHLLSEAAGLFTAGLALPDHPKAAGWKEQGWRWLNHGLQTQIEADGTYAQHSTNYHRMMLQIALWTGMLAASDGRNYPELTRQRLGAATHWLLRLLDQSSGRVPNLGPNDGAYIFTLTCLPFEDYRPVLQAASLAFLGEPACEPGLWDEMGKWFGVSGQESSQNSLTVSSEPLQEEHRSEDLVVSGAADLGGTPHVLKGKQSWAYLRVARFSSRPGHADQLHLDLWWRGLNLAGDPGTYLYNGEPPWDNALARTALHNTLTVNGQDQMQRAGRFLWLRWAQGHVISHERALDGSWERIEAEHNGYRTSGWLHRRRVSVDQNDRWVVEDQVLPVGRSGKVRSGERRPGGSPNSVERPPDPEEEITAQLQWLVPDLDWELEDRADCVELRVKTPWGWVSLKVSCAGDAHDPVSTPDMFSYQLVRAGELLAGSGPILPVAGWVSPTYGIRLPALALKVHVKGLPPLRMVSEWRLP